MFRIADHVRDDFCNGPCLCLVQALLKTPRPSADRPLAKSERRPFLIGNFVGPDRLKNDDGPAQAFKTPAVGRDQKGGGRGIRKTDYCLGNHQRRTLFTRLSVRYRVIRKHCLGQTSFAPCSRVHFKNENIKRSRFHIPSACIDRITRTINHISLYLSTQEGEARGF